MSKNTRALMATLCPNATPEEISAAVATGNAQTEATCGLMMGFLRTGQLTVQEAHDHIFNHAPLPADCGQRPLVMAPPTPEEIAAITPEQRVRIQAAASRVAELGPGATPESILEAVEGANPASRKKPTTGQYRARVVLGIVGALVALYVVNGFLDNGYTKAKKWREKCEAAGPEEVRGWGSMSRAERQKEVRACVGARFEVR